MEPIIIPSIVKTEGAYSAVDDGSNEEISLPIHELETVSRIVHRDNADSLLNEDVGAAVGLIRVGGEVSAMAQTVDWSHRTLGIEAIQRDHGVSGAGVTVAILDTGIDASHADLTVADGRDFTHSRSGWRDVQGHGTHVAGIVAALNNGVGVVGAAPAARLIAGKVLGDNGSGSYMGIAQGITWATQKGAAVINMSLGGSGPIAHVVRRAIDNAIRNGIIVCVAAGNSGPREGTVGSPGNYARCVTVGATDPRNNPARFTSRGETVDVAAPGVQILSTYPGNRLTRLSGTSMATPLVSGLAALFVEKCRQSGVRSHQGLFERLATSTARDIAQPGKDTSTGYGLIQPRRILDEVVRMGSAGSPNHLVPVDLTSVPTQGTSVVITLTDGESIQLDNVASLAFKLDCQA